MTDSITMYRTTIIGIGHDNKHPGITTSLNRRSYKNAQQLGDAFGLHEINLATNQ